MLPPPPPPPPAAEEEGSPLAKVKKELRKRRHRRRKDRRSRSVPVMTTQRNDEMDLLVAISAYSYGRPSEGSDSLSDDSVAARTLFSPRRPDWPTSRSRFLRKDLIVEPRASEPSRCSVLDLFAGVFKP
mmetsp:Transcript_19212/g.60430  ORF Transcript_19212/g.60430 Transcript_19212/m.60430 type:complete len:129 (+) Transcript_19212:158-544(+)